MSIQQAESRFGHRQIGVGWGRMVRAKRGEIQIKCQGKILYSRGGEALVQLPRELWVPYSWRCSRPGGMGLWAA